MRAQLNPWEEEKEEEEEGIWGSSAFFSPSRVAGSKTLADRMQRAAGCLLPPQLYCKEAKIGHGARSTRASADFSRAGTVPRGARGAREAGSWDL